MEPSRVQMAAKILPADDVRCSAPERAGLKEQFVYITVSAVA